MKRIRERVERLDGTEVLLALSGFVIAINAHRHIPLLVVAVAFLGWQGADFRRLRRPWPWLLLAGASLTIDLTRFLELDDHTVLSHYWALAIGLSLLASDPERSLARNGRWLVGLTMAFSVGSKLAWGEFVGGGFFEATILLDERFIWLADAAGITDPAANYAAFGDLARTGQPVELQTGRFVVPIAVTLTAGTLVLEGWLAFLFLAPGSPPWLVRARISALVLFCILTYSIAPVAGFGSVLLVMAGAERHIDRRGRVRLAGFAALLVAWSAVWVVLH